MNADSFGQDDKERALEGSLLFQSIEGTSRRELASRARMKSFKAGDVIFRAGDPGGTMMAVAVGTVRISVLTPTSRDVVLAEMGRGEILGEIALLDGGERSADAAALTNCTLVVLDRRDVISVLERDPALAVKLIAVLCGRIRKSDQRMLELTFLELPERLARVLVRISAASQPPASRLSLSQSDLANMIGATRENVNRCLRAWQKRGMVDLRDGWLVIVDRAGIEALASRS